MDRKSLAVGVLAGAALAGAGFVGYEYGTHRAAAPPAPAPVQSGPITPLAAPRGGAPASFASIVKRVSPAVVSIDTVMAGGGEGDPQAFPFGGPRQGLVRRASGSGFVISADGYVVTNNHVVEGAQDIVVSLQDGRQMRARLVGRDPPTDLAVLKIEAQGLPFVSFAASALPEVGDWVIAVGNPFGLGGSATAGIVSAHARDIGETFVTYLQIDAPINSGNSGGPSFDLQGRVVGVNTAIFSPSGGSVGIGFAIPADLAERVTRELIASGRVTRGYLGVGIAELTPGIAAQLGVGGTNGAVIADVARGGPAAGLLRPGDVVTAVGAAPVTSATGLTQHIGAARPGDEIALQIVRDGKRATVRLKAGLRPDGL
jgi:serine protease Do